MFGEMHDMSFILTQTVVQASNMAQLQVWLAAVVRA